MDESKNTLKISEMFKGIQGEGAYAGHPVFFVRLSGCNRSCDFCDTKYHVKGKEIALSKIASAIMWSPIPIVITGGEPLWQWEELRQLLQITKKGPSFHLESNGDLVGIKTFQHGLAEYFDYLCFSPKFPGTAARLQSLFFTERLPSSQMDIKVVTDLSSVGIDLLPFATMLMPLTTDDLDENFRTKQKVWQYCLRHGLKYSPRLHVDLFGTKKGV